VTYIGPPLPTTFGNNSIRYTGIGSRGDMFSDVVWTCAEYNVAVFVTNQMTADPGATLTSVLSTSVTVHTCLST